MVVWKRAKIPHLSSSFFTPPTSLFSYQYKASLSHSSAIDGSCPPPASYLLPPFPISPSGFPPTEPSLISVQSLLFILTWPGSGLPLGPHIKLCVPFSRNGQHILTPLPISPSELTQMQLPWGALSEPLNEVRLLWYISPGNVYVPCLPQLTMTSFFYYFLHEWWLTFTSYARL